MCRPKISLQLGTHHSLSSPSPATLSLYFNSGILVAGEVQSIITKRGKKKQEEGESHLISPGFSCSLSFSPISFTIATSFSRFLLFSPLLNHRRHPFASMTVGLFICCYWRQSGGDCREGAKEASCWPIFEISGSFFASKVRPLGPDPPESYVKVGFLLRF